MMISTYIVVEGSHHFNILMHLLPDESTQGIKFVVSGGNNSAPSLSTTLLMEKHIPLVLLLDADTVDEAQVQTRRSTLESLLNRAPPDTPRAVLLAVPEIEGVFLQNKVELERLFSRTISNIEWTLALRSPKVWLESQLAGRDIFDLADEATIETWRNHKLMLDLMAFLHAQATPVQ